MAEHGEADGGRCLVRCEGDILFVRPSGYLSLELARLIPAGAQEILERYGYYLILADLAEAGLIHPEGRRVMAEYGARNPPRAIAFYHVGVLSRAVNALLFGAMKLFSSHRQNWMQFSREEDARAWLDKERQR